MRVTIADRALSDEFGAQLRPSAWWLLEDGLDGWYSRPAPRATSDPIPDFSGGYWPSRFLTTSRTLAITGAHSAETSSLARAEAEDWVASLPDEFSVIVEDEAGIREVRAFQSAEPDWERLDRATSRFTIYCTAPDPVKYGPTVRFTGSSVENAGRTAVLPLRIVTTGPATSILVILGGHRIRWAGTATNVVIDTREGTATGASGDVTTGLVEDDIPLLPPGATPMTVTTDAASWRVEVRPGWL